MYQLSSPSLAQQTKLYILTRDVSFKQVDSNGKEVLVQGESVAVSLHLRRMANGEHLHRAFSCFDKVGNGVNQICVLLNNMLFPLMSHRYTRNFCTMDGWICCDEF